MREHGVDPEKRTASVSDLATAEILVAVRHFRDIYPSTTLLGEPATLLGGSKYDQHSVTINPYWEIVRLLPIRNQHSLWGRPELAVEALPPPVGPVDWQQLQKRIAWAIPSPGDLSWLAEHLNGRAVLDMGAGLGYWAWQLSQVGIDVTAVDRTPNNEQTVWCDPVCRYHPVSVGSPEVARDFPDHALLLCWPPSNGMATASIQAYRGDTVIFIGMANPDICAEPKFFHELDTRWDVGEPSPFHISFYGLRSTLVIARRR